MFGQFRYKAKHQMIKILVVIRTTVWNFYYTSDPILPWWRSAFLVIIIFTHNYVSLMCRLQVICIQE